MDWLCKWCTEWKINDTGCFYSKQLFLSLLLFHYQTYDFINHSSNMKPLLDFIPQKLKNKQFIVNWLSFWSVFSKPVTPLKLITFTKKGIYCPQGKFYIDPWRPVDIAVITHGHADHARWGMKKYLCHHFTKPILYQRIAPDIECQSVEYGEVITINGVKLSLHPAGHIIGSAQTRLE